MTYFRKGLGKVSATTASSLFDIDTPFVDETQYGLGGKLPHPCAKTPTVAVHILARACGVLSWSGTFQP